MKTQFGFMHYNLKTMSQIFWFVKNGMRGDCIENVKSNISRRIF